MGRNKQRVVAMVGGLLIGLPFLTTTASADVIIRATYSGTDSFSYSDCGYRVETDVVFSGRYQIRAGKNDDETAYFLTDNYSFRETHTNVETGERFLVRGNGVFRELRASRVEGNVFKFVTMSAGQPYVVEDGDGNVVLRDRGTVQFRLLFDTGGDQEPGGELIEFLGADVRGPHPGSGGDFCRIAGELVGTESARRLTARPAGATTAPLGYYEYLPAGYGEEPSPLLLFLHGFGESGDGSAAELPNLLGTGVPRLIDVNGWAAERPFVVLAPQHAFPDDFSPYAPCDNVPEHFGSCALTIQHELGHPADASPCTTPAEVRAFLSFALAHYDVDPSRVYVTGLSCGAFAAWEYLAEGHGPAVAAAVPIAGEGRPAWQSAGCDLGDSAIWAFHGDADEVVAPAGSTDPLTNLAACPAPPRKDPRLTVYPGVGHDSWTRTYDLGAGHDIYEWMLGFSSP